MRLARARERRYKASTMSKMRILFLALALAAIPLVAAAHPHVFIDAEVTFEVDENGVRGVRQHWLFDEMFTRALLGDLDLPLDDSAPQWSEKIKSGAFDYLKNSDYFTAAFSGGERLDMPEATEFEASLRDDNRLIYDFFIPLRVPAPGMFRLAVYDKEYYADILLKEDAIAYANTSDLAAKHTIRDEQDLAYWAGFNIPRGIHVQVGSPSGVSIPTPVPPGSVQKKVEPSFFRKVVLQARAWQKALKEKITPLGSDIRDNPLGPAFWTFLALSFLYGVVHAVGPGHGKSVVCSYFLARPGDLWLGALMGNAITFVHVGSAIAVVAAAYLILGAGMGGFHEAAKIMQPASYGLLMLMGVFLAVKAVLELRRGGILREAEAGAACTPDDVAETRKGKSHVLLVSFVTGLIPCPGAAVVLAFAVGLNILWSGLAAMFAMAVGMGLTTTLFAWAAVGARGATLRMAGHNRTILNWSHALLTTLGALFIAAFGAGMLAASL